MQLPSGPMLIRRRLKAESIAGVFARYKQNIRYQGLLLVFCSVQVTVRLIRSIGFACEQMFNFVRYGVSGLQWLSVRAVEK